MKYKKAEKLIAADLQLKFTLRVALKLAYTGDLLVASHRLISRLVVMYLCLQETDGPALMMLNSSSE